VVVEARDPVGLDLRAAGDAELLLGLHLGREPVAVPAEAAFDAPAPHRLVAGHDVLDVAGDEMAVVREAVREGRAVVEDVLVRATRTGRTPLDRLSEDPLALPVGEHAPLDRGEAGLRIDGRVAGGALLGHEKSQANPLVRRAQTDS
jgi:hypothetical protein